MTQADKRDTPKLIIREENPADYRTVEEVTREAFWNRYAPGCNEHWLVNLLRKAPEFHPWHSLVAEYDGHIIGHALLSPAEILLNDDGVFPVMALGPLTVLPAVSRRGIGSSLMRCAIQLAKSQGISALMLTGDPDYYHRFGFVSASGFGIHLPDVANDEEAAFFMALPLSPGALDGKEGIFKFAVLFDIGESPEFEAYDSGFPKREKLRLPGQLK